MHINKLPFYLDDLLELIYPSLCITCGERLVMQENYICLRCWADLPAGHFEREIDNKIEQLFRGRVFIEKAVSWFQYRKGSRYQKLIHYIKYKGLKELGLEAGKRYGRILSDNDLFDDIDAIIPVPLHERKRKTRGYNQSEWIAMGLADSLQKPLITDNLVRLIHTPTQTRKGRFERWQNVEGIFGITTPANIENLHILLVDDVVTTGSTLEACAMVLLKISGVRLSIVTLAYADYQ